MGGMFGAMRFAGRLFDPDPEIGRDFTDGRLAQTVQFKQKVRDFTVLLIKGYIIKTQPLGHHAFDLLNANLPGRTMHQLIRNARTPAAISISIPAFGKIQIAGHHATERVRGVIIGVKQVLANDTIVLFAGFATPLTLNTGGVAALFGMGRGV